MAYEDHRHRKKCPAQVRGARARENWSALD